MLYIDVDAISSRSEQITNNVPKDKIKNVLPLPAVSVLVVVIIGLIVWNGQLLAENAELSQMWQDVSVVFL